MVGWTGVDSTIRTRASVDISSSVHFKKSNICVAVALRLAVAAGGGRADVSVDSGSFVIFKSKIGLSKSSSSAGSTFITEVGRSSSSSVVSLCTEAVVDKGHFRGLEKLRVRHTCQNFDAAKTVKHRSVSKRPTMSGTGYLTGRIFPPSRWLHQRKQRWCVRRRPGRIARSSPPGSGEPFETVDVARIARCCRIGWHGQGKLEIFISAAIIDSVLKPTKV
uniref:Uncharacterized protein n=1 Tax=Romanomermis culicivorax TaxID=13658 RepID=A0A915KQV9_ROMCU